MELGELNRNKSRIKEVIEKLSMDDLRHLTNQIIDRQGELIADCIDADVVFVPVDPDAHDAYADNQSEVDLAWTLGHVIVHTTASSEESAFLAAELARGVPYQKRRSRSEVPWETVMNIPQCQQRLAESRRMRLSSLDMWPDLPALENRFTNWDGKEYNAVVRFVYGLFHEEGHLAQIEEIVRQAKAARGVEGGS